MLDRQSGDFGIREVSRSSGASTSSIYHWFGNKDHLARAVIKEELAVIAAQVKAAAQKAADSKDVGEFIDVLVQELGERVWRKRREISVVIDRAAVDPVISARGAQVAHDLAEVVVSSLVRHIQKLDQNNHREMAITVYQIIVSVLTRRFSDGLLLQIGGSADDLNRAISQLGTVCRAYLHQSAPPNGTTNAV